MYFLKLNSRELHDSRREKAQFSLTQLYQHGAEFSILAMFIFCIGLLQCLNECHVPVLPEVFQDIFSFNLCIPVYSNLYIPSTTMFSDLFNTYHNFEDEKNWSRKEIMLRIRRRKMRIIMMRSYTECHVEETRYL